MAAVLRDTVFYASLHTNKYVGDARQRGGRLYCIPFEMTYASVSTVGDTYNLCVLPANAKVVDFWCVTTVNAASVTFAVGDAGSAARYMVATAFVTVNSVGILAATGAGFIPTADTIVVGVNAGAAGTVGAKVTGYFQVIPGA